MPPKKTILCVDDDELTLLLLNRILQRSDSYQVAEARSGRECLDVVSHMSVDLIILDYELGDMNGLDVCREIAAHSINSDVPVIMASVVDSDDIRGRGRCRNITKVVQKPYMPDQILHDLDLLLTS